ncbi:hypothetical protein [Pseudonocardia sp. ICBG601]|uniref:hypothetical protein n=1 Tax=Pseudonocardia sp. ICBG601 TaxID=2846759 RepID=UPI001CF6D634|nr:hypothetical protein [Pseudonocardia sp. ICBG601]
MSDTGTTAHRLLTGLLLGGALALAAVAVWWLVMPADWSVVPTADPDQYVSPVTTGHWTAVAVGLAVLAALGGAAGRPGVTVVAVALPALALYCWKSATATVIGANLWPVGALFAVVPLVGGAAVVAFTASGVRRRRRSAQLHS